MPWELGYFDGRRPGRIGILPIVASAQDTFAGVEYLALYPLIQDSRLLAGPENSLTSPVRVVSEVSTTTRPT